jgi:hypothetical protein
LTKAIIDYHTIINNQDVYVDTNNKCYTDDYIHNETKMTCIVHINQQLTYDPLSKNPHLHCTKCLGEIEQ